MTAEELKEAGRALYGYGWQTTLASLLGVDGSTVRRWVGNGVAVPPAAAAVIRAFTINARLRAKILAYEVTTQGEAACMRIVHLTDVEKDAFGECMKAHGVACVTGGPRDRTSMVVPEGHDPNVPKLDMMLDENGKTTMTQTIEQGRDEC